MKSVIIIPYFGKSLPKYFLLFLKSVEHNKDIDIFFYSDLKIDIKSPPNFFHKKITLEEYSKLLKVKTGLDCKIKNPYKLCDHRPLYGKIFNSDIKDYDYWGFGDIDLIFGDLNYFFIQPTSANKYDIVSYRNDWLSGSMCFFSNQLNINELYTKSADYKKVVEDSEKHYAFDEASRTNNGKSVYHELLKGKSLIEMDTEIESFTEVVLKNKFNIKFRFKTEIKESISNRMILKYDYGKISIEKSKNSFHKKNTNYASYHFITEKNKPSFRFPNWKEVPDVFFISQYGFHKSLNEIPSARLYSIFNTALFYLKKTLYITTYKKALKRILY